MKKGAWLLLITFVCSLCIVLGIFVGRNMRGHYAVLPTNIQETNNDGSPVQTDFRIDLNTATERQLTELPGIGEIMAKRIVDYRTEHGPFLSTDDLLHVNGIGEKTLQEIQMLIKAGG